MKKPRPKTRPAKPRKPARVVIGRPSRRQPWEPEDAKDRRFQFIGTGRATQTAITISGPSPGFNKEPALQQRTDRRQRP